MNYLFHKSQFIICSLLLLGFRPKLCILFPLHELLLRTQMMKKGQITHLLKKRTEHDSYCSKTIGFELFTRACSLQESELNFSQPNSDRLSDLRSPHVRVPLFLHEGCGRDWSARLTTNRILLQGVVRGHSFLPCFS